MLKEYKKGMMQKIFSRELRFKDDSGRDYPEWEDGKIKNIITEHLYQVDKPSYLLKRSAAFTITSSL